MLWAELPEADRAPFAALAAADKVRVDALKAALPPVEKAPRALKAVKAPAAAKGPRKKAAPKAAAAAAAPGRDALIAAAVHEREVRLSLIHI